MLWLSFLLLFGAAALNGLLAPLLVTVLLISNSRKIMQGHTNGRLLDALGILATLTMAGTAVWLAVAWGLSHLQTRARPRCRRQVREPNVPRHRTKR